MDKLKRRSILLQLTIDTLNDVTAKSLTKTNISRIQYWKKPWETAVCNDANTIEKTCAKVHSGVKMQGYSYN